MRCRLCTKPRKPRKDRPGKFYTFCEDCWLERERRKGLERYYKNKEKRDQQSKAWAKAHPDRVRAIMQKHRSTHRARIRAEEQHRRTADGNYTLAQWEDRINFYGRRCYLCGCDWDMLPKRDQTIDHVIPLSQDGTNWPSNLRPACRSCNSRKHNKRGIS